MAYGVVLNLIYEHLDRRYVDYDVAENIVHKQKNVERSRLTESSTSNLLSRKRSQAKDSSLPVFIDLTMDTPKIRSVTEHQTGSKRRCRGSEIISHSQSNSHAGSCLAKLLSVSGPPSLVITKFFILKK
ncbi:hypothetical protein JHK87_050691 [Glycine soja]|nr:hypothetical protein JHK87_050691 [Glycine soja]